MTKALVGVAGGSWVVVLVALLTDTTVLTRSALVLVAMGNTINAVIVSRADRRQQRRE